MYSHICTCVLTASSGRAQQDLDDGDASVRLATRAVRAFTRLGRSDCPAVPPFIYIYIYTYIYIYIYIYMYTYITY